MALIVRAFGVVLAGLLVGPPAHAAERLAFGTTNTGSSHYSYAVSLGKSIAAANTGVDLTLVETGGSVDNVRRMAQDRFHLGITTTDVLYQAWNGVGVFDKPVRNVRTLFLYTPAPMVIAVRADSGITSVEGLDGQGFNPGLRGSSAEKLSQEVYKILGIKPNYFYGSVTDALEATKDRKIAGFSKAGAGVKPDASVMELQTTTQTRVLGFTDEQIRRVLEKLPYFRAITIPAGTYQGQDKPIRTFGFIMAIAVSDKVSDDVAYKLIKAIVEHKGIQESAFETVKGVDYIDLTLEHATAPIHPGAVKYFQEKGRSVPAALTAAR